MKKQQYARIEEGFFNFVTDYINQPKVDTIQPKIDAIQPYLVPKGGIIIWSGAGNAVPSGWALCDGTNGTPDLRGRFVIGGIAGTGFNSIGNKGGVTDITLRPFHLPPHTHSGSITVSGNTNTTGNHSHSTTIPSWGGGNFGELGGGNTNAWSGINGWKTAWNPSYATNETGNHSHTVSASGNYTTNDGNQTTQSQAISVLNPYYALAYIMKL